MTGPAGFYSARAHAIPGPHFRGHEMSAADEMAKLGAMPADTNIDTLSSTRSARWRWMPCRRRNPAIPARRWPWRRSPTRCGRIPALRPGGPELAEPRPLRAVVGHASMLLYALLHLAGVTGDGRARQATEQAAVTLDDIKQFRQLEQQDARAIPNISLTTGVETTTGPLGQGCGNSVGMAIGAALARRALQQARLPAVRLPHLRAVRRRRHDGGRRQRGRLARRAPQAVATCAGSTTATRSPSRAAPASPSPRMSPRASRPMAGTSCTSTTPTTRRRCGRRSQEAEGVTDRPTMIIVHSIIGYGAPHKQGTREAHGEPLGDDEIKAAKKFYGWPEDAQFLVPRRRPRAFRRRRSARAAASCGRVAGDADALRAGVSGPRRASSR